MKNLYLVFTVFMVLLFAGCANKIDESESGSCVIDSDCACGISKETGGCAYGNKEYIDASKQCPDFCSGITGKLSIKCELNRCVQKDAGINSFEECVKAGYAVMESYPRLCRTPDGKSFTENVSAGGDIEGSCTSEGGLVGGVPPAPGVEASGCCYGLKSIPAMIPYNEICDFPYTGDIEVCAKCGDGDCGIGENKCNCPADCNISEQQVAMPNPAAAYCERKGYEYKIVIYASGDQSGECKVNGEWVDEWALYRNASLVEVETVGGGRDEYGCYLSAGYSWCKEKQKCVRPWEENCSDYTVAEMTNQSCVDDSSCVTPERYLMLSHCPYSSKCLGGMCAVICPFPFKPYLSKISSFEECVEAGYPTLDSYPRQCETDDGRTFVEVDEGITAKAYCENAGGRWNNCGSMCRIDNQGKTEVMCPTICDPICECAGSTNLTCPMDSVCRKPAGIPGALGYCVSVECVEEGGLCCKGDVCSAGAPTETMCVEGASPALSCDASCNPVYSCEEDSLGDVGLANPAAVYCEKQGGETSIVETIEGQAGYCSLPDGRVCEEWVFYRVGECNPPEN